MTDAKHSIFEKTTTVEKWDRDYYHPVAGRYYDSAILDMLELMEVEPTAPLLDAGCGPGVHSIRAARAGYNVTAIDISQTMLHEARSRASTAGVSDRIEFLQEDLTDLRFSDASFRYVFSWGVIIHIREIEKALNELTRILEPGGKLALYVTNNNAFDHKLERFIRFLVQKPVVQENYPIGTGSWYKMDDARLWVWQFDIAELQQQMKSRGLRLLHRRTGEFSELQRRVADPIRSGLLHLNNVFYRLRFAPTYAIANLLIFQKETV